MKKTWDDDDNLVVAWLILVSNPDTPTDPVSEDSEEFIRACKALDVSATQLTARVNMLRSNLPGYKGPRTGNPMNSGAGVQRVVDQIAGAPTSVKMLGGMTIERLEEA